MVESYRPDLVMDDEDACVKLYSSLVIALLQTKNIDYFIAETLSSVREMELAIRGYM